MSADEGADGVDIDPVETANDLLRTERRLATRGSGVIVTHAVTALGNRPVRFQLVDPLPSKFDVEEIDFHPDHEPPHGRIDAHAAVISGVVDPEQELIVRYGLRPTAPEDRATVGDYQQSSPPSIELSESVDPDEADAVDLDIASMSRGESGVVTEDPATEGFYFGIKRMVFGADADEPAPARGAGSSAEGDDRPEPSVEGDDPDEEPGTDDEQADDDDRAGSGGGRIPGGDPFGGTNEDASLAASISEIESAVSRSDPDEESTEDDEAEPFREFFEVRRPDEDEPGAEAEGDVDVVTAFVRQLESDRLSEEQRRSLGAALADVMGEADRPSRSTEVRLRELESKLEEFAVYAAALKELIDVHGPAEEFLSAVRGDIESLEEDVAVIRGELGAAAKARSSLDDRLEEAVDDVALVDSRVKRLRNRVDDLEVAHDSDIGALESTVESLEDELDRLDRIETDIRDLQQAVDDGRAKRRAIVEALREDESTNG